MKVFEYSDYRKFVTETVRSMPNLGRGEMQRIAKALSLHTTSISHIFSGKKDLSCEHAAKLCGHWGLSELESDYFLNLVQLDRAGNGDLRDIISRRIAGLKERATDLVNRIPKDRVLSEADKSRYYSQWYIGAIRLLCEIPDFQSPDQLASSLGLSMRQVNEAIEFLVEAGLCGREGGVIKPLAKRIFLESTSSLISRHHTNWRIHCLNRLGNVDRQSEQAFTSPMTVSRADSIRIKQILAAAIEEILEINSFSPAQELRVLNIDWLKIA